MGCRGKAMTAAPRQSQVSTGNGPSAPLAALTARRAGRRPLQPQATATAAASTNGRRSRANGRRSRAKGRRSRRAQGLWAPWYEHDATPKASRCCQQCWPQQPKSQSLAAGFVKHTAQPTIGAKEGGAGASPATHLRNMFACKNYKKERARGLANDVRLSQDLLS